MLLFFTSDEGFDVNCNHDLIIHFQKIMGICYNKKYMDFFKSLNFYLIPRISDKDHPSFKRMIISVSFSFI
jgi:hypothetical protein